VIGDRQGKKRHNFVTVFMPCNRKARHTSPFSYLARAKAKGLPARVAQVYQNIGATTRFFFTLLTCANPSVMSHTLHESHEPKKP